MKKASASHVLLAVLVLLAILRRIAHAQPCETFTGSANGWYGTLATVTYNAGGYLTVGDQAGGSWLTAPSTYYGDWWKSTGNCGGRFCFNIRVLAGAPNPLVPVARYVTISSSSGYSATFVTTASILQGQTWYYFCAPFIAIATTGVYPTSPGGAWTTTPAALTPAQWYSLFQTVNGVAFGIDMTSYQDEVIEFDNICIYSNVVVVPTPTISGPVTACNPTNVYCISNYVATQYYSFQATDIYGNYIPVTFSSAGCITVTWPATGGVLTVSAVSSTGCGSSKAGIKIAACDPLTVECCKAKNISVISKVIKFSGNTLYFYPTLNYPALTAKVVTTLVGPVTYSTVCPTGTTSTIPITTALYPAGTATPSGFTGSIPYIPFSQEVDWLPGNVWSTTSTFPLTISTLPAAPAYPCTQQINFCVKYSVFSACCSSCDIYECYSAKRGPRIIIVNPGTLTDATLSSVRLSVVNADDTPSTDPIVATVTSLTGDPTALQGYRAAYSSPAADGSVSLSFAGASFTAAGSYDVVINANSTKYGIDFSSDVFTVTVTTPAKAFAAPAIPTDVVA